MLKNKKLLFTILFVALLLLIPNIVKADERTLSNISITVPEPVIGQTLPTANDIKVVADGATYQVHDVEWYEMEVAGACDYQLITDSTHTCIPNTRYKVSFLYSRPHTDLIPRQENGLIDFDNLTITKNGRSVHTSGGGYSFDVGGDAQYEYDYVSIEFEKAKPEAIINSIDLTIPTKNAGDPIRWPIHAIQIKLNGSIPVITYEYLMYKYNPNTGNYDAPLTESTFEEDTKYKALIYFTIPNKYEFSDSFNSSNVKINGKPVSTSCFSYEPAGLDYGYMTYVYYEIDTSEPVFYSVIEGKDPIYKQEEDGTLRFKIDGPLNKFMGIYIGDNEIAPKNYEVSGGSTVVILKEDYLKSLAAGKYELTFLYSDGYAISDLTITGTGGNAGGNASGTGSNDPTKAPGRIPYAGGTLIMILSSTLFVIAGAYAFKKTRDLKGI